MFPKLFSVGHMHLRSWGLMVAISFLTVIYGIAWRAQRRQIMSADDVFEGGLIAIFSGLLGARVAYVIEYWSFFVQRPLEIVMLQRGGLVFYGGLLGALAALWVWSVYKEFRIGRVFDLTAPVFMVGIGIGRLGCFLNGCCAGKATTLPWGVLFPGTAGRVHPTQLYDSAAMFTLATIAFVVEPWLKHEGQLIGFCLVEYTVFRFLIEYLRVNPVYAGLSSAQWISLPLLAVGLLLLLRKATAVPHKP